MKDSTKYNHELTDKAFDKLVPMDRHYESGTERSFIKGLWELYVLHMLPVNYWCEEDIKRNIRSMKAAKCLLEGHLYNNEIRDFKELHKRAKKTDINTALGAFINA